ncbi:hypothetical protein [Pusillimonas noertemannii]|uniref:hypothetical protein n=1 Tax=Pusillimonas noertemannii TaxID=305977 RepID=UPI0002E8A75B|nr:hypothetical protein [Pusillimonas noertemannii]
MLKKFVSGAGVFALSVLAFSFIRQIIVLPAVARYDDILFVELTYAVFTFEAVAYAFAGAIPDYYVRMTQGDKVSITLMNKLSRICLLGLTSVIGFAFLGIELLTSILLAFYLYIFSLNALRLKIVFAKLKFQENFIYMGTRSAPYLILFLLLHNPILQIEGWELQLTIGMLLGFEILYAARLSAITRADREDGLINAEKGDGLLKALLPFILSALLIGFIQRGDMTFVRLIDEVFYLDYAKLILTINFFCAPLALMVASPMLSFISRHGIKLQSKEMARITSLVILFSVATGIIATVTFGRVYDLLYGGEVNASGGMVFYICVAVLLYAIVRTLIVRYVPAGTALFWNILVIVTSLIVALLFSVYDFVIAFFALRLLGGGVMLYLSARSGH